MPNQLYRKKTPINKISNDENEINSSEEKMSIKIIFCAEKGWGFMFKSKVTKIMKNTMRK